MKTLQGARPQATQSPVLITMGDAAGIGPEVIVQAFQSGLARGTVVVGDLAVMRRATALWPERPLPVALIDRPEDAWGLPDSCMPLLQAPGLVATLDRLPFGRIHRDNGAAAARCIEAAVAWVQGGSASAIVTAPIHKEALHAAGVSYPGHTEMLQALARVADGHLPAVRMMLANDELRVVLVTIHLSLRRAIDAITFDAVLQTLQITQQALARFGIASPRIAVAGLNPHAGEGGLFGDEEQHIIGPAIAAACAQGIDAQGPFAPDTVFMRARHTTGKAGEFDAVVAMTHDHGLIPVKYLGVEQGVNVTLGLPFVRTSPDHGTAFDIAGTGRADPSSLLAALRMAQALSVAPA
jgi:4-hydroxythreonine-4-phosphate dehydrogenase